MILSTEKDELIKKKQKLRHEAVPFFEDGPCYELEDLRAFHSAFSAFCYENDLEKCKTAMEKFEVLMASMKKKENAPERIYLWKKGNMPTTGAYTENPDFRYNHDPEFEPYMFEMLVDENEVPKGAVVVCAGGDHGDCTMHEGLKTCLDFQKMGYQSFLLLNRTNQCPYDAKEAGADAARALQIVRKNAEKYRIDPNRVAFAGFSNGGLTAEACIQYFSGTQKISTHFEQYEPDEYDAFYGAPDANICVYGPRFVNGKFDYTNAVYPPTFFAVGRDDSAMDNLNATLPDLMAHHVEVEVHTFAGVPHGQSGVDIYGENKYPHFQLWLPLADAFLNNVFSKAVVKKTPELFIEKECRFDAFLSGNPVLSKKKGHLPAMGWNSWNAFGSGNTEELTKQMADQMVSLGLKELGYEYVVLDDGCYRPVRENGKLANELVKFPNGFRALSDYIHNLDLKFGMYNDIGTNLCAGASVGTCGHEKVDAQCYVDWGVDFLKVDNCYYLWDNATFSDANNAKYVYAPNLKAFKLTKDSFTKEYSAVKDAVLFGNGGEIKEDYVTNLGTFDGTGPEASPVGMTSAECRLTVEVPEDGEYELTVTYATAMKIGTGSWLQIAVSEGENAVLCYDDFMKATPSDLDFEESKPIVVSLKKGTNLIRFMNHRRQENTLCSYATLLEGLNEANPNHDIIFSICEWGKTQPQNWGYKVGDSWRILNDITFQVGADGDPGVGSWTSGYTTSVTTQYSKAVIMDEFAGLDKGWNDPDMLMVGMNGLTDTMCKTHMAMWCMMNSPLMLGLDLRRVTIGDPIYQIIANKEMIALNQDALGVACKRVYTTVESNAPDKEYIRDMNRVDICAKPLADGSVAISFFNLKEETANGPFEISVQKIVDMLGNKIVDCDKFANASQYQIKDLWSMKESKQNAKVFSVNELAACDNVTIKVTPINE